MLAAIVVRLGSSFLFFFFFFSFKPFAANSERIRHGPSFDVDYLCRKISERALPLLSNAVRVYLLVPLLRNYCE